MSYIKRNEKWSEECVQLLWEEHQQNISDRCSHRKMRDRLNINELTILLTVIQ